MLIGTCTLYSFLHEVSSLAPRYEKQKKAVDLFLKRSTKKIIFELAKEPIILYSHDKRYLAKIDESSPSLSEHSSSLIGIADDWKIKYFDQLTSDEQKDITIHWIITYQSQESCQLIKPVKIAALLGLLQETEKSNSIGRIDYQFCETMIEKKDYFKLLQNNGQKSFFSYLFQSKKPSVKKIIQDDYVQKPHHYDSIDEIDLNKIFKRPKIRMYKCPICGLQNAVRLLRDGNNVDNSIQSTKDFLFVDEKRTYTQCKHQKTEYEGKEGFSIKSSYLQKSALDLTDEDFDKIFIFIRAKVIKKKDEMHITQKNKDPIIRTVKEYYEAINLTENQQSSFSNE